MYISITLEITLNNCSFDSDAWFRECLDSDSSIFKISKSNSDSSKKFSFCFRAVLIFLIPIPGYFDILDSNSDSEIGIVHHWSQRPSLNTVQCKKLNLHKHSFLGFTKWKLITNSSVLEYSCSLEVELDFNEILHFDLFDVVHIIIESVSVWVHDSVINRLFHWYGFTTRCMSQCRAKSRSWQLCTSSKTIYHNVKHSNLQFGMILQQTSLGFPF